MFCSLILLVGAAAFQAPAPPPEPGVIKGRVLDSLSGEPIRKANVIIQLRNGAPTNRRAFDTSGGNLSIGDNAMPRETAILTDATGNFRATVVPGTYFLRVERNGYVASPLAVPTLTVTAGDTANDVTFKMNKHGVITGRVLDEDGEPVARATLQCHKWMFIPQTGQRRLTPQGLANTNDLGEYRIFGIAPGKYLVSVQDGVRSGPYVRNQPTFGTVYFPGVPDIAGAQTIEITPGLIRQGVDLRLQKVKTVVVSGKLGGLPASTTPERRPGAMIQLIPRHAQVMSMGGGQYSAPVGSQGSFEIASVPAGSYTLMANTFGPNQERRSARFPIEVGDRDITGVSLSLEPTITINGQIRAEDSPSLATVSLTLISASMMGGGSTRADAEGRITVNNLEREVYRPNVMGLPAGYYVSSIQLGSTEAKEALDLTAGAAGELVITLEKGTGEVSGVVMGKDQKPAASVQVMALNGRNEVIKTVQSDDQGHYTLPELPPGDYKILPISDLEASDPDTFDRLAATAAKVTLARSARETRQIELR